MYRNDIMRTLKQAHHINIITASVSPNQIGYIDKVSRKQAIYFTGSYKAGEMDFNGLDVCM